LGSFLPLPSLTSLPSFLILLTLFLLRSKVLGTDALSKQHGADPILSKLRLKDLRKYGYIDWIYPDGKPKPDLNAGFRVANPVVDSSSSNNGVGGATPAAAAAAAPVPGAPAAPTVTNPNPISTPTPAPMPIHAVFAEKCWRGLKPGEYDIMAPALRLASCLLSEPSILGFFIGLFGEWEPLTGEGAQAAAARLAKRLKFASLAWFKDDGDIAGAADAARGGLQGWKERAKKTMRSLVEMSRYVTWGFDLDPVAGKGSFAITSINPNQPGLKPG